MADFVIKELSPILADIGKVALFVSVAGMVINLAIGAFTKGRINL